MNASLLTPELSVVVAAHERPLRLRWLLNALEAQSLDPGLWEVVVGHDSAGPETERMLASHPLAVAGRLRWTRLAPGTASPGANRNAALRLARAPTAVFTDDDCRPPRDWLENVRAAVALNPGAIVQGPVQGDPDEVAMLRSTYPRTTIFARVPRVWAECTNIVYPRAVIEQVGGFAEDLPAGADTDLNLRARRAGVHYAGEERMLTFHAIEEASLWWWIRASGRRSDLALLLKRHPELRRELALGLFWKSTHAWLPVAAMGLGMRHRDPWWVLLTVPWALARQPRSAGWRRRVRRFLELPGWAMIDLAEMTMLARGSLRHRAILL